VSRMNENPDGHRNPGPIRTEASRVEGGGWDSSKRASAFKTLKRGGARKGRCAGASMVVRRNLAGKELSLTPVH